MIALYQIRPGAPGLVRIAQSLARSGVRYETVIERKHAPVLAHCPQTEIQITLRATGTPVAKRTKPKPFKFIPVPDLTRDQITRRLAEAQRSADHARDGLRRNFKYNIQPEDHQYVLDYSAARVALHKRIGHAVARIVARHKSRDPWRMTTQDYAELDQVIGRKVERQSKIGPRYLESGYLHWFVKLYAGSWRFNWKEPRDAHEPAECTNLGFVGCKPFYAPDGREPFNAVDAFLGAKADLEYWQELKRLTEDSK